MGFLSVILMLCRLLLRLFLCSVPRGRIPEIAGVTILLLQYRTAISPRLQWSVLLSVLLPAAPGIRDVEQSAVAQTNRGVGIII